MDVGGDTLEEVRGVAAVVCQAGRVAVDGEEEGREAVQGGEGAGEACNGRQVEGRTARSAAVGIQGLESGCAVAQWEQA